MKTELAFVLLNTYTLAKSRTGGVIGRFLSRTGLELVGARMYTPSLELAREYAELVRSDISGLDKPIRDLLADYVEKCYTPDVATGRPQRIMLILLEGEDAIRRVRETAGDIVTAAGETIRDTFGDYVVDEHGKVQYFEPAVLIGVNHASTEATLKLWGRHADDGGIIQSAADSNSQTPGWQRTLVLIKPDNFRFPNARPGNIIDVLSRSGLRIISANVHRMSVRQAEEFYGPVRSILREKMKEQVSERVVGLLEKNLMISHIPPDVVKILEEQLGPLMGDEQFYRLIKFMTGSYPPLCKPDEYDQEGRSKCLSLVYGGVNAVQKIRNLLGSTDPSKALPGSVRREFGRDVMVNAAHASDSPENAEREISILKVGEDCINSWINKYYP